MTGKSLLFLRLEGPLQSWGLRARWDVRDSGEEPSKSAIVGLLGCALGYPMYDPRLEVLERKLLLGIRVEHPGRPLVDFHTITGILPCANGKDEPATIVSHRTYLQDAAFLAILEGPNEVLAECSDALKAPCWPIYLGRKSCPPSRPVLESLIADYDSLQEALEKHLWDWQGKGATKEFPSKLMYIREDKNGNALRADCLRVNPARMYDFRRVVVDWVDFPGVKEELECTSRA
ncbi:MAG: type I-E CRISPR-associated protein Cas5/CasD [bacterium]